MMKDADCSLRSASLEHALAGTCYRAVRKLGEGTSSEVFAARGPLGELRAVKVLRPIHEGADEAALRLTQEGRVLAELDHPHVVKVLDVGLTADGRPYFVMDRLRGETLRERLDRDGKLPPVDACSLMLGVLDGLDAAHRAGIVHRDVKPSNIFLCRGDGPSGVERAILLDFGIAKVRGSSLDPTGAAFVIGTPRYLAPEQILGGRVDARTDVYSMGILLFEVIAGRGPFDAKGPLPSMRAHLNDKPHALRKFVDVPPELEKAVARALRKEPDRRWPSAGALAAALRGACVRSRRDAGSPGLCWSGAQ